MSRPNGMNMWLGALAAMVALPSLAQQPDAGRALDSVAPTPRPPQPEAPPVERAPTAPPAPALAGPSVLVKSFRISGNTVFASGALLPLLTPFEGRQLSIDELTQAADLIKDKYRSAGYFLAQVLIPTQSIVDGSVELRVVEGRLGEAKATLGEGARVKQSQVDGYMGLLPRGSLVTEQGIERPLLLLNDLPGIRARSVLKPGAEFGTANLDVEVNREGKPVGGAVYLDGYGNRNIGMVRLGVDVEGRGLLGYGELLAFSGLKAEGTTLGRVGLTVPVGVYGTKVSLSYTDLSYDVGGAFAASNADGYGRVASLVAQHPFIRSRNSNLFLIVGADRKDVNDRQQDGSLENRRSVRSQRIGLNGDFRDDLLSGALNSYSLSWLPGDNRIRTPAALINDQSAAVGHFTEGRYSKVQFEYLRLQGIRETPNAVLLSLRGQRASKNLDASEKTSLGGPRGVRSYPVGAGAGDDLLLATVEYRYRLAGFNPFGGAVLLSAFIDHGRVRGFHSPLPTDSNNSIQLSSFGVGVNVTKRDDFQFRLDLASRLGSDEYRGDDNKRMRAWASLQKSF